MLAALQIYTGDNDTQRTSANTLHSVFADQVRPRLEAGRRALSTIEDYERAVRLWTELADDPELEDIDEPALDRFLASLVAKGLVARTINKTCGYLQTVLNHCGSARRGRIRRGCLGRSSGLLDSVPEFTLLEEDEPQSRLIPTSEQVQAMLQHCRVAQWPTHQPGIKWETLIRLLLWCGPRRTDAFSNLTTAHWIRDSRCPLSSMPLHWPHGWLCWTIGKTKRTKQRPHVVPLSPQIAAGLCQIVRANGPDVPLLGFKPQATTQWYREFYRIQSAVGITTPVGFHGLRKLGNIEWDLACGIGTGEKFLGHSAKSVNQRCYSDTAALMVRAAERRLAMGTVES